MRKLLTRALLIAALSSVSMMAFADGFGIPYYARGPRIIHVPQPGDDLRDSQASLDSVAPDYDDDDAVSVAPPPRRAVKPVAKPHKTVARTVARTGPSAPTRRKPFSVSVPEPPPPPEPTGPRRALLSAPPPPTPSIHDGPTPIRPTPRFGEPLPHPVSSAPAMDSAASSMPAPEPVDSAVSQASDDHLPPPGDPRLAPPEPAN